MTCNFISQSMCIPDPALTEKNISDQTGKVFIVTGGYSGIGYQLSKILFQLNGTVYIAGRSKEKADTAISNLKKDAAKSNGRLEFLQLDLADLASIQQSAKEFMSREHRLDVLTNNAGVMEPPAGSKTRQGFELQMGTNCLGPFLFTRCLLPLIRKTAADSPSGSVRVTWAGSISVDTDSPQGGITFDSHGAPKVYDSREKNYGQSKSGNIFLAREMARRYGQDGVVSVAWNPGLLKTDLIKDVGKIKKMMIHSMQHPAINGAYTELYAGWSKEITLANNGCYVIPWGANWQTESGYRRSL